MRFSVWFSEPLGAISPASFDVTGGGSANLIGQTVQSVAGSGAGRYVVTVGGYSLQTAALPSSTLALRATTGPGAATDFAGNAVLPGPVAMYTIGMPSCPHCCMLICCSSCACVQISFRVTCCRWLR